MAEPMTLIGAGALATYLAKDSLQKILGPTSEYLGDGLRDLTKRRVENIGRIFRNAEEKLGDRIDSPGEVPPRVLKVVLNEGSYCDDELAAEYFGGVLASSRTGISRDDRGARIAKILDGPSTYQIRAHFLVYGSIRNLFQHAGLSLDMVGRPKMKLFLPIDAFAQAMDFSEAEVIQFTQILTHTFFGLSSEDLIDPANWQFGRQEHIVTAYPAATSAGIICQPSALGAELFLWAFGRANERLEHIFDASFHPLIEGIPLHVEGCQAMSGATTT
ncbi:hypothetical protein [Stenotrophomonas rhizophila]|uniref:hypothetical protein n=1 Tax=Stenotrophomonas rhizophila TaxID=216778 RepID=UPI001AEBE5EF|nr:hypothetical protein [Stenotrophomonas rhizophila]